MLKVINMEEAITEEEEMPVSSDTADVNEPTIKDIEPEAPNPDPSVGTKEKDDKEIGIEIEYEHAPTLEKIIQFYNQGKEFPTTRQVAEWVVEDHVGEFPEYYNDQTGLPAMERTLTPAVATESEVEQPIEQQESIIINGEKYIKEDDFSKPELSPNEYGVVYVEKSGDTIANIESTLNGFGVYIYYITNDIPAGGVDGDWYIFSKGEMGKPQQDTIIAEYIKEQGWGQDSVN